MNPKPSSLDFYAFIQNYSSIISGSFIKKVYQVDETDFLLQLYSSTSGKNYLLISLKKGLVFYEAERPEAATPLSMLLRKSLSERRIVSVEQINFDRVVKFTLHTGQEIILELFRDGNFIITNEKKIEFASDQREWKNRKILKGEPYVPPSANNPLEIDDNQFGEVLEQSKASLVQTLATRLNLGGDMAEEVLFRLGINKDLPAKSSLEHVHNIRNGIGELLSETGKRKSYFYQEQGLLSPVPMLHLKNEPDIEYDDLNKGMLDYLQKHYPSGEAKDPITRRIESMEKSIEEFQRQRELNFQRGNAIMQSLTRFDSVLRKLSRAKDTQDLSKIKEFDGFMVSSYNSATKEIGLEEAGNSIVLDINITAGQNANNYFQKSKDFKSKIEGAYRAIEETKAKRVTEKKETSKKKKREWFEIYHWFISSEDFLVISGRDAKSNERIVKKHLKDKDLYVHADVYGAPSTIIKIEGTKVPTEQTIREACAFAISFSRAWPAGVSSGAAYWVLPSQVSKTPESGEYVSTGSWIVRGKRNYLFDLPMRLAILIKEYKGEQKVMSFPVLQDAQLPADSIVITPGDEKRNLVSQKISRKLGVPMEDVDPILPPGNSSIISGL